MYLFKVVCRLLSKVQYYFGILIVYQLKHGVCLVFFFIFYFISHIPNFFAEHMVSHLAFVIVIGILVFVSHNPVCAIGLFVTLFFSVLYHMALSLPHKNDEQYQKRKAFYVNLFSVFDYVGIISGSTLALVWNKNILVMPSAWTW